MFIGQSLHEPGMYSQIPFILGSGLIIDAALRLSGIDRHDCYWTNIVKCHPERNRASTDEEKENCWYYLSEEIRIVQPRVVVALGKDAKQATEKYEKKYKDKSRKWLSYVHPASLLYASPESRPNYIVKLSLDIDKILGKG
jgi:DNA polymerase